jgi:Na+/phosphate symporter
LTVVLQSISTTIVMVIAFATAGLLNFEAAIYLVLGDNIGTA